MRVLIIEDESPAVKKLVRMLDQLDAGIQLLEVIPSVEASINWLNKNESPDLIFMDVQLEDGLCFEIFETIRIDTPIIFTTAYDKYAIRAFGVNSVDYLLKPYDQDALKKAVDKYKLVFEQKAGHEKWDRLIQHFQPEKKERFLVRVGEHYRSVKVTDIHAFYIRERYNFILTFEGRSYPVDFSLDRIGELVDERQFFRVNRNIIINQDAIRDIIAWSSSRLKIIIDGWDETEDILVSRERVNPFKKWMDR